MQFFTWGMIFSRVLYTYSNPCFQYPLCGIILFTLHIRAQSILHRGAFPDSLKDENSSRISVLQSRGRSRSSSEVIGLLQTSSDWAKPTHVTDSSLLCSKSTDWNANHISKNIFAATSRLVLDQTDGQNSLAKLTHKINDLRCIYPHASLLPPSILFLNAILLSTFQTSLFKMATSHLHITFLQTIPTLISYFIFYKTYC